MGAQGNLGIGKGKSRGYAVTNTQSGSRASELSNMQLAILQNRENLFNQYFLPEIQNSIASETSGTAEFNSRLGQAAEKINTAYGAAEKSLEQKLSQQGITDSGVSASLRAANERARASALAKAYADTLSSSNMNKMKILSTLGNFMPQPTRSAEYYTSSVTNHTDRRKGDNSSLSLGGRLDII